MWQSDSKQVRHGGGGGSGGGNGIGGGGDDEGWEGALTVVILVQWGFPWQDMTSTDCRIVLLPIKV